jgi:hypothetical protein
LGKRERERFFIPSSSLKMATTGPKLINFRVGGSFYRRALEAVR